MLDPGTVPLTAARALTAWTFRPAVLVGCAGLAGAYGAGLRRVGPWPRSRTVAWGAGVGLLVVVGCSVIGVYDDTLFWARAVQGVVLLLVAPVLLAFGAPWTLARATVSAPWRLRLGRLRRSRVARAVTHPAAATALLILPPFLIYLTALHLLMLASGVVSGVVSVGLLSCGFVYAASRLQIDPLPRRTHHGLTLFIAAVEIVADGVLGLVLWLGPLIAVHVPEIVAWAPDPRTDQVIGAGVWWIGGDVVGLPFLLAIMSRFAAADEATARELDAAQDVAERREPAVPSSSSSAVEPDADEADADTDAARRRALWWQDDPYLAARFRRR